MSETSDQSPSDEFRRSLSEMTDEELIARLNREVRNPGWVSSRGHFLVALRAELATRDFDTTAVHGLQGVPGRRKFLLEDKRLTYVD